MRVLLIDVNCKNSSTGKIVYDLYTMLRQNGDEAAVCYGRGEELREENIYKFGLDWETMLHALLTRITGWTGCFSFFSTRRLLRFVEEFRPDVVHIHELHAYFVNLRPLLEYLQKNHIRTVHTLHCEFTYTGKCGYSYQCDRWKADCGSCPRLREYVSTLCFDHTTAMLHQKKKLLTGFDDLTIVAPSKWLADRAGQSFLSGHRIEVIPNGVDTDIFHPWDAADLRTRHHIAEGEKVVLAVAPNLMEERKGGRQVLKLAERMAGEKVRFILIGVEGPDTAFPANAIALPPMSDKEKLAQYYSLADCFVICSERETFSMTCAESLCCGTPVAGFRSGAPETVFLEPEAIFVEYNDLNALQAAVCRQLSRAGEGNGGDARSAFSKDAMFRAYYRLYSAKTPPHKQEWIKGNQ